MKPQPKRVKLPANAIAEAMGLVPPLVPGQPQRHYGTRALPGQYVKSYIRQGHLPPGAKVRNDGIVVKHPTVGRISKGMLKRYNRDHGTEARLDLSESINARR